MGNPKGDFGPFEKKMKDEGLSHAAINAFRHNYEQLVAGVTGLVAEDSIDAIDELPELSSIAKAKDSEIKDLLAQTAVLKLNGGLGTSMGLEKAKSLLEVRDGKTFLDLIALQVEHTRKQTGAKVRFVLMNSFSTSDDTKKHLSKAHKTLVDEKDSELMQNKSPKIDAETLQPATYSQQPDMEWCPPGHGDIYPSLVGSGMMQSLRQSGIKFVFVSNSDNLGATLDLDILAFFANSGNAFLMEVAKRTAADKKGGHLARRKSDGRLLLRESAMVSDGDKGSFEDISKHKYFNTNNLWVNLDKLEETLKEQDGLLKLPLIKNKKTVNPRDSSSAPVFQLETAMGSAIECFKSAGAVMVPRSRFAPVKTCGDLFVLRSDAYKVTDASTVELVRSQAPSIKLDDKHYKLVDKMEALTLRVPSLVDATSLTVKGPVKFPPGVVIKGDVSFINDTDKPIFVKEGIYENQIVNLKPSSTEEPQKTGEAQPAYA